MKKNISRISFIVHQNEIFSHKDNFIFGLSGGQDSLLNLLILYHLQGIYTFKINLIYCNHFWQKKNFYLNLQLFKLAYLIQFPLTINVSKHFLIGETSAHEWRHASFLKLTQYYKSNFLVLGHTASDQIETAVWHFLRGTSPKGLISLNEEKKFYLNLSSNQITNKLVSKIKYSKRKFLLKQETSKDFYKKKFSVLPNYSIDQSTQIRNLTTNKLISNNFPNSHNSKLKLIKIKNISLQNSYLFLFTCGKNSTYNIKRPLLKFYRTTIAKIIRDNKLPFNYDITNKNLNFSRNKIRLVLLPLSNYYLQKKSERQIKKYIDLTSQEQKYFNSVISQVIGSYWFQPQDLSLFKKIPKAISEKILLKILDNYFQKQVKITHFSLFHKYRFDEK